MTKLSDTPNAIKSVNEELGQIRGMFEKEQPFTKKHATILLVFTGILAFCSICDVSISIYKNYNLLQKRISFSSVYKTKFKTIEDCRLHFLPMAKLKSSANVIKMSCIALTHNNLGNGRQKAACEIDASLNVIIEENLSNLLESCGDKYDQN